MDGYYCKQADAMCANGSYDANLATGECFYFNSSLSSQRSNTSSSLSQNFLYKHPGTCTLPVSTNDEFASDELRLNNWSQVPNTDMALNGKFFNAMKNNNFSRQLQHVDSSAATESSLMTVDFSMDPHSLSTSALYLNDNIPPAPPPAVLKASSQGRLNTQDGIFSRKTATTKRLQFGSQRLARGLSTPPSQTTVPRRPGSANTVCPIASHNTNQTTSCNNNWLSSYSCSLSSFSLSSTEDSGNRIHFRSQRPRRHTHHSNHNLSNSSDQQLSFSGLLPKPASRTVTPNVQWAAKGLSSSGWRAQCSDRVAGTHVRCASMWQKLVSHHMAKKKMEVGIKLYRRGDYTEAVIKWSEALQMIQREKQQYKILGYICQAYAHWGRYRSIVELVAKQLELANSINESALKAEAYLNMARCHERLGNVLEALKCCHHSLFNCREVDRNMAHTHVCLGNIYTNNSSFSKAIEHYEVSLNLARQLKDIGIELLVFVGIGQVFSILKDYKKGLHLVARAFEISKQFCCSNTTTRHKQMALLGLVTPLRKLGRLAEALECCQDALQVALNTGDRPMNARGLCFMADILRQKGDFQRAYRRYSAAFSMLSEMGDQLGQILSLSGMAKSIDLLHKQSKVCECRPLEAYNRLVKAISNSSNKMLLRNTHDRISQLYSRLNDKENYQIHYKLTYILTKELSLVCRVCTRSLVFEEHSGSGGLEALACSHLFHQECANKLLSKGKLSLNSDSNDSRSIICPECRCTLSSCSGPVFQVADEYSGHYPAFVPSSRAVS